MGPQPLAMIMLAVSQGRVFRRELKSAIEIFGNLSIACHPSKYLPGQARHRCNRLAALPLVADVHYSLVD